MTRIFDKILVTGACGQVGTELTLALRRKYGWDRVIATDIHAATDEMQRSGPYFKLDVLNKKQLGRMVQHLGVGEIYHLAAVLSAKGESDPRKAWDINMEGLLNILESAKRSRVRKLFWPSSIAVFGRSSQKVRCPQSGVAEPSTAYGISKLAGEQWCKYYFDNHGLDVRSLRYPGLIGYGSQPGGGTTDYAVDIFYQAIEKRCYKCFLKADATLPMMYMPDAVRATLELMDAPSEALSVRTAYNVAGMSFNPEQLAAAIREHLPDFSFFCEPDFRQKIADSWPGSVDDSEAVHDWGWQPSYDLHSMTADMLHRLDLGRQLWEKDKHPVAQFVNGFE